MPTRNSYDYAVIRVVPRVEREEFVNVGVILSCPAQDFLEARLHVDRARLIAFDPQLDFELLDQHLRIIPLVCSGDPAAGAIARLPPRQRFYWLVAPRSTIIQTSVAHSGLCNDTPRASLDHLMATMVLPPGAAPGTHKE